MGTFRTLSLSQSSRLDNCNSLKSVRNENPSEISLVQTCSVLDFCLLKPWQCRMKNYKETNEWGEILKIRPSRRHGWTNNYICETDKDER
jgi:hypothetical protein